MEAAIYLILFIAALITYIVLRMSYAKSKKDRKDGIY